jgi:hypothetical protein
MNERTNKQTRRAIKQEKIKQAIIQSVNQSFEQTTKNQQSCPFPIHIISAALHSKFYALNFMP